jgi:hypothetical protein
MRDTTDGYKQVGEFPAHGMEPHDIQLLSDGRTMVIANGGIRTSPDSEGEVNLPDMQPSLVYVDIETGDLLEQQRLKPSLHQLSIHRLPISQTRAGCSAAHRLPSARRAARRCPGAGGDASRLAQLYRLGGGRYQWRHHCRVGAERWSHYLLGRVEPALSRRIRLERWLRSAPTHRSASFLLTSGEGWLVTANADGEATRQSSNYHWDKHAILVR